MPSTTLQQVVVPIAAACSAALGLYYLVKVTSGSNGQTLSLAPPAFRLRLKLWALFHHLAASMLPHDLKLRALSNSHRVSSTLYAVAKLEIFEAFKDGAHTAQEVANKLSSPIHSDSLFRILQYLASQGIFTHDQANGRFSLTGTGALLLRGPGSQLPRVLANNDPQDAGRIGHNNIEASIQKGGCAFQHATGQTCWQFYDGEPRLSARFEEMMEVVSHDEDAVIAAGYPGWPRARSVVDVAGGPGVLLRAIVKKHTHLRNHATVFERAAVVQSLDLAAARQQGIDFASGDFFGKIEPAHADIYILRQIMHDWADDVCIRILENVKAAMHAGSRLLIVDTVILGQGDPLFPFKTDCDIDMMVWTGGRERSRAEFARLLSQAGFELLRVFTMPSLKSIVEAVLVHEGPAWHQTISQGVRLSRLDTLIAR